MKKLSNKLKQVLVWSLIYLQKSVIYSIKNIVTCDEDILIRYIYLFIISQIRWQMYFNC